MAGYPDRVFSAADLAATLGLGQPTVSKILKLLGQRALVKSSRGARGGYTLGRPADQISIAHILNARAEQPLRMTECKPTRSEERREGKGCGGTGVIRWV